MWTAFPSSDYYGRSATRPPRRRRFSRAIAAYPCDLPTRPGFPGFLADTQTPPLRPRPFCTRQRSAAPPDIGGQSGRAADLGPLRAAGAIRRKTWRSPARAVPYSGVTTPGRLQYWRERGMLFPKVLADSCSWSYGSSTWRNSHGYEASPVFRFVRGTVWPTGSHVPSTYPVGMAACHPAAVRGTLPTKLPLRSTMWIREVSPGVPFRNTRYNLGVTACSCEVGRPAADSLCSVFSSSGSMFSAWGVLPHGAASKVRSKRYQAPKW